MPKGRVTINESELVAAIHLYPILYDPKHPAAGDEECVKLVWEKVAHHLDASTEQVLKAWDKWNKNQKKRRSLKSPPIHDDLSSASLPLVQFSNDNSCVSSVQSSPRKNIKRITRSMSTASESATLAPDLNSAKSSRRSEGKKSKGKTPNKFNSKSITDVESSFNISKYQDEKESIEHPRAHLAESHLASKETLKNAVSTITRRLSDANTPNSKNKSKKNPNDPTLAFFESMAMTVMTFPQHIQATIKVQICNIVLETEYELSIPAPC